MYGWGAVQSPCHQELASSVLLYMLGSNLEIISIKMAAIHD